MIVTAVSVKNHKWFKIDWTSALQGKIEPPFKPEVSDEGDTHHFDDYPDSDEVVNPDISDHDKAQFDEFDSF